MIAFKWFGRRGSTQAQADGPPDPKHPGSRGVGVVPEMAREVSPVLLRPRGPWSPNHRTCRGALTTGTSWRRNGVRAQGSSQGSGLKSRRPSERVTPRGSGPAVCSPLLHLPPLRAPPVQVLTPVPGGGAGPGMAGTGFLGPAPEPAGASPRTHSRRSPFAVLRSSSPTSAIGSARF